MFDKIRTTAHCSMTDSELTAAMVNRLPHDDEGAMFWA